MKITQSFIHTNRAGLISYVWRTGKALLVTPEVLDDLEKSGEIQAEDTHGVDWLAYH